MIFNQDNSDLIGAINQIPNPNLFDNWYFVYGKEINNDYSNDGTFPINQRGYQGYGAGYGIDRWAGDNTPMYSQIGKDYITIWNGTNFEQILDPAVGRGIIGKEVTFSILTGNNDLGSGSGTVQDTDGVNTVYSTIRGEGSVWFVIGVDPYRTVHCYIQLGHGSSVMTIKAVKLELGSIQTLAHQENGAWVLNEIPNYQEELVKCIGSHADASDTYANRDYSDLNGAINAITPLDTTPTSGSTKGITSGAVQSSLSAKQDTLSTVTGQVTSAGVLPLDGILLKKYGNVVFLYMASSGTPVAMTVDYTTIATLPVGFRPSSTFIKKDIIYTNSGRQQEACTTQILNNGAVQIACPGNNNYEFLRLYATFIVD